MKCFPIALVFVNIVTINTCLDHEVVKTVESDQSDLKYLIREAALSDKIAPVLVLLHGYASNEKDLFSLSAHIPKEWLVIFVQAQLQKWGIQVTSTTDDVGHTISVKQLEQFAT